MASWAVSIAAVILPNSILSNDNASYTGAREVLLKNFFIRGIAAFGSKTFGATGTNTVVMFLEKFNEPPKQIDLCADSVESIFSGCELAGWKDKDIFDAYLAQIEVGEEIYRSFINKTLSISDMETAEYFKMYVVAFAESTDAKNLLKTRAYKNKSTDEQVAVYLEKFYGFAHTVEREKLLYFSLVYQQTTVIISAPSDNTAQKNFLGYDWSNRKGNEGIQILTPGGKMYNDANRAAEGTLANAIKQSFTGNEPSFNEEQQDYGLVVDTKDILDFSRINFNKSIALYGKRIPKYISKYPLVPLGNLSNEPKYGSNESAVSGNPSVDYRYIRITDIMDDGYLGSEWMTAENIDDQYILQDGDFLFARTGATAGKYFLYETHYGKAIYAGYLIRFQFDNSVVLPKYIKNVLRLKPYTEWAEYNRRGRNINATRYSAFQIPLPPIPIQEQIIAACARIDTEYEASRSSIETFKQQIKDIFAKLDVAESGEKKLCLADPESFDISIGKRVLDKQLLSDGVIPVFSANVTEAFGYINEHLITDFSVPSVLWGIDGDWMTSYMSPNKEFYPTDHCGVLRCKTTDVNPRYMVHILEVEGKKMGFSRSYRASIDRVQGIVFSVPDITVQNEAMEKVVNIEKQILEAREKMASLNNKRAEIIQEFL